MIDNELKLPFYLKAILLLIGIIALLSIFYIARAIIVPIVFALIIAILLHPVVNFFVQKKINRIVAIIITLFLTVIILASIGALLFSQINRLSESWPVLVDRFTELINQTINWASGYFNINKHKILEWIAHTKGELISSSGAAIGQTLMSVGNVIVLLFLLPVYNHRMEWNVSTHN